MATSARSFAALTVMMVMNYEKKDDEDFTEVRVAVVGNVDAGKSTLLGVLTHDTLDDGRGTARLKLFRHKHEAETGRTSSVGNDILGFDSKGGIVNKPDPHSGALDWQQICQESSKVLTFIDNDALHIFRSFPCPIYQSN